MGFLSALAHSLANVRMGLSQNSSQNKQDQVCAFICSFSRNSLNCWHMLSFMPGAEHTMMSKMAMVWLAREAAATLRKVVEPGNDS